MRTGDFIKLAYTARIKETGQEFDRADAAPVIVGAGYVIPGVDEALAKMAVGEKKTVEVTPDKAFGHRDPKLIKTVPLTEFRRHRTEPKPGMWITADSKRGKVISVASGRVLIDFNHPLAGRSLLYDLEIREKIEDAAEKLLAIAQFYTKLAADKIKAKILNKEAELQLPPAVHSIWKKKIADDAIQHLGLERVKFIEVFAKPRD
jgi:FKBP-type peptidyl-prolyl cis-trans isomerase SlyD